ncbi:LOW QUALITY PROTEIN: peroxiredoxin-like 2C [Chiroxiphia lanceolata]|uniref:LOW QUALITY PROTEIN: peroxiredoxin-like 2C n=1 Tax=Chiroxiphia lanceolata TaxID=296741 RepID=UPI0013CEA17C|nr:LOW QUALITY PROTEIN: peroxiredoxin-like 2C [Chiroxiphia lanceolata]
MLAVSERRAAVSAAGFSLFPSRLPLLSSPGAAPRDGDREGTWTSLRAPSRPRRFLAVSQPLPPAAFRASSAFPSLPPLCSPAGAMAGPRALPVTQQVGRARGCGRGESAELREEAARCPVLDRDGRSVPFQALYGDRKAIVVFVRNFLCYTCKEYVEDLAKVPKAFLQEANVRLIVIGQSSYHHIKPFCSLTGYTHEMYVDPQREIYKMLGMKRGEGNNISVWSPHVKSNTLLGSIRSIWRAMTGPAFDFQGDPAQQGGALIIGPGNEVHFLHLDKNRLDHVPINTILQLAGVKTVNFSNKPQIIDI